MMEERRRQQEEVQKQKAREEKKRQSESKAEERQLLKQWKLEQLGEEPPEENKECALVVFRKPTGNGRITRRFLKTDKVEMLYYFIDTLTAEEVGFEEEEEH
jgi:hypothetical protein